MWGWPPWCLYRDDYDGSVDMGVRGRFGGYHLFVEQAQKITKWRTRPVLRLHLLANV